jgi:hypothetical protein
MKITERQRLIKALEMIEEISCNEQSVNPYGAPKNSDHVLRCKMTSERGAKHGQETAAA